MGKSNKVLNEALRNSALEKLVTFLTEQGEEVLQVASNSLAVPCVDEEGNEKWLTVTVKVPTGERGGDPYDGYEEAEAYADKVATNEAKAKAKAEEKAKKIARDKAEREAKAKAKAEAKR